ncbi:MAG: hypothetical protein DMF57_13135, partial [Acidobacteria bacterium]
TGKPNVKYTGGGQFHDLTYHLWSFGFNVDTTKGPDKGHFNAKDHDKDKDKDHINGPVSDVACVSDICVTDGIAFTVTDKKTQCQYRVEVEDGGKHNDKIQIYWTPSLACPSPDPDVADTGCQSTDRGEIVNHQK